MKKLWLRQGRALVLLAVCGGIFGSCFALYHLPLRRSRLGSISEGAGSPNGLTEGVSYVGCCKPMVSAAPCTRGRLLGDLYRTY